MLPLLLRNLKQHFHLHPRSELLDYRIHFPYIIVMTRGRCCVVQQARAQARLTTILGFRCGKSLYCQLTGRFWGWGLEKPQRLPWKSKTYKSWQQLQHSNWSNRSGEASPRLLLDSYEWALAGAWEEEHIQYWHWGALYTQSEVYV